MGIGVDVDVNFGLSVYVPRGVGDIFVAVLEVVIVGCVAVWVGGSVGVLPSRMIISSPGWITESMANLLSPRRLFNSILCVFAILIKD